MKIHISYLMLMVCIAIINTSFIHTMKLEGWELVNHNAAFLVAYIKMHDIKQNHTESQYLLSFLHDSIGLKKAIQDTKIQPAVLEDHMKILNHMAVRAMQIRLGAAITCSDCRAAEYKKEWPKVSESEYQQHIEQERRNTLNTIDQFSKRIKEEENPIFCLPEAMELDRQLLTFYSTGLYFSPEFNK